MNTVAVNCISDMALVPSRGSGNIRVNNHSKHIMWYDKIHIFKVFGSSLCYNRVQRQIWVLILSKFVRINFYYPWNQKKTITFLAISRGIDTFSWMFWSNLQGFRRPAIKHVTELYEFCHGRFSGNFLKISKGSFSRACAKKIL